MSPRARVVVEPAVTYILQNAPATARTGRCRCTSRTARCRPLWALVASSSTIISCRCKDYLQIMNPPCSNAGARVILEVKAPRTQSRGTSPRQPVRSAPSFSPANTPPTPSAVPLLAPRHAQKSTAKKLRPQPPNCRAAAARRHGTRLGACGAQADDAVLLALHIRVIRDIARWGEHDGRGGYQARAVPRPVSSATLVFSHVAMDAASDVSGCAGQTCPTEAGAGIAQSACQRARGGGRKELAGDNGHDLLGMVGQGQSSSRCPWSSVHPSVHTAQACMVVPVYLRVPRERACIRPARFYLAPPRLPTRLPRLSPPSPSVCLLAFVRHPQRDLPLREHLSLPCTSEPRPLVPPGHGGGGGSIRMASASRRAGHGRLVSGGQLPLASLSAVAHPWPPEATDKPHSQK